MKQTPWVVMMPEDFDNYHCKSSGCNNNECEFSGNYCPLASAKKADEVQPGTIISLTTKDKEPGKLDLVHKVNSKPVTLYAVEMEAIK